MDSTTHFGDQNGSFSRQNAPGYYLPTSYTRPLSVVIFFYCIRHLFNELDLITSNISRFLDPISSNPNPMRVTRIPTRPKSVSIDRPCMVVYSTSNSAEQTLITIGQRETVLDELNERCSYCNVRL